MYRQVVFCLVVFAAGWAVAQEKKGDDPKKPVAKGPAIRIAVETTRITKPLTKDGTVDYLTALDEMNGKGVERDRNLARVLWKAVGARRLMKDIAFRRAFQKKLDFDFAEGAPRLTSLSEFVDDSAPQNRGRQDALHKEYGELTQRPWTDKDSPGFAKFLQANKIALDRFVAASAKCDQYYAPMVNAEDDEANLPQLIAVLLPTAQETRVVARILLLRITHSMGRKDVKAVQRDLVALKRLARGYAKAPTLIEILICYAVEGMAVSIEEMIAKEKFFDETTARAYLAQIAKLPKAPRVAVAMDICERFMALDSTISVSRNGFQHLGMVQALANMVVAEETVLERVVNSLMKRGVDWNEALIQINGKYDEMVKIAKEPHAGKRAKAAMEFGEKLKAEQKKLTDPARLALAFLGGSRKSMGRRLSTIMCGMLLPAMDAAINAETRTIARSRTSKIRLAISAYEKKSGKPPAKLDDLVPGILSKVPIDIHTNAPYRYTTDGETYQLQTIPQN